MRANFNGTLLVSATTTTQNVALPSGGGSVLLVTNSGANTAYIELGSDSNMPAQMPTANVGGGVPILANQPPLRLTLRATDTCIAAISDGTSSLWVTRGDTV